MKELYMTVGLPRSGKTTYSQQTGFPIVNPDSIRFALHGQRFIGESEPMVWAIARYMVISLFGAGHDAVVLDATNTTVKRRDEWVDKRWRRIFVPIDTDKAVCISRAESLNDTYIIPIIEKMSDQFEQVTCSEVRDWENLKQ